MGSMLAAVVYRWPEASFDELMKRSRMPRVVHSLPDVAVVFMCMLGGQASYLIVIGDALQAVTSSLAPSAPAAFHTRQLWIFLTTIPLMPLVLQRHLHALRFASTASVAAMAVVALGLAARAVNADSVASTEAVEKQEGSMMQALPVFIFGFTCHQQLPSLSAELAQPSPARLAVASSAAVVCATVVYGAVGACGYFAFGRGVASDVLLEMRGSGDGAFAAVSFAAALATSLPMWSHAGRESFSRLLCACSAADLSSSQFVMITAATTVPSFVLALWLDNLGVALGLVGGTGCSIVSLVLPGLFF